MSDAPEHGAAPPPIRPADPDRIRRALGVLVTVCLVAAAAVGWAMVRDPGTDSSGCSRPGDLRYQGRDYRLWPTEMIPERGQRMGQGRWLSCGAGETDPAAGDPAASQPAAVRVGVSALPGIGAETAVLITVSGETAVYLEKGLLDGSPRLPAELSRLQQPMECRVMGSAVVTGRLIGIEPDPAAVPADRPGGGAGPAQGQGAAPPRPATTAPRPRTDGSPGSAGAVELPAGPYVIVVRVAGAGLAAAQYTSIDLPVRVGPSTRGGRDAELLNAALAPPEADPSGRPRMAVRLHCVGTGYRADQLGLV